MRYLIHYLKIFGKILSSTYFYSRIDLMKCYGKLVFKSVIQHKFKLSQAERFEETILGFSVKFFSYIELITLFEEIFIFQVYNFSTDRVNPVIVDCGSNIGLSVLYFKMIYPASKIIAFEPDRLTFDLLQENIRRNNLDTVTLYKAALTNTTGDVNLFKNTSTPGSLNMSLIPSPDTTIERVPAIRLSAMIKENIDLLKIDVEGSEPEIIGDLIETNMSNRIKQMIIEFHPLKIKDDILEHIDKLNKCGFLHRQIPTRTPSADRIVHFTNRNIETI